MRNKKQELNDILSKYDPAVQKVYQKSFITRKEHQKYKKGANEVFDRQRNHGAGAKR